MLRVLYNEKGCELLSAAVGCQSLQNGSAPAARISEPVHATTNLSGTLTTASTKISPLIALLFKSVRGTCPQGQKTRRRPENPNKNHSLRYRTFAGPPLPAQKSAALNSNRQKLLEVCGIEDNEKNESGKKSSEIIIIFDNYALSLQTWKKKHWSSSMKMQNSRPSL